MLNLTHAHHLHLRSGGRRVTLILSGTLTDRDLFAAYEALYADPGHRVGMDELTDCRAVERVEVTTGGLVALAAATARLLDVQAQTWRVAIVAPSDIVFGMARMYEAFRAESPEQVQVFRDRASAEAWLGR